MLRELHQFTALNFQQKTVFVQAWFMLAWFRAALLTVSFRRLAAKLEHHPVLPASQVLSREQLKRAASIGKMVATAARYTPWQSLCLVQVLVAQRLLARRNIPGQFYLGVRKGSEDGADPTGLSAHAWLQCDDVIVNGGAGHQAFTVVSTFTWGRVG